MLELPEASPEMSPPDDGSIAPRDHRASPGDLFATLFTRSRHVRRPDADGPSTDNSAPPPGASEPIPDSEGASPAPWRWTPTSSPTLSPTLAGAPGPRRPSAELSSAGPVAPPPRPTSLSDAGLSLGQLSDLVLKLVYLQGTLTGSQLAAELRLPFRVVDEALAFLRQLRCLEARGGHGVAEFAHRYLLTDEGRTRAREAFEQCRYVGPAPVSLRSYVEQCRRQTVAGIPCTPELLAPAFADVLIRPGLLEELGPAICDGQAIFLYGPSGNGKSVIARRIGRFLNTSGGEIYVPYAVLVDGQIVAVFDPNVHQTTDDTDACGPHHGGECRTSSSDGSPLAASAADLRWRRIRRPVVVTAGELTLDMLDLRFHAESRFYVAPLHLKANGGVFVIDDFGRQQISPRALLNRWILPLGERLDYLALATGKKFAVPFEQLTVFSTNLEPRELVEDAFLRRIRHKLQVTPPTREQYGELFERVCREAGLPCDLDAVRYLFTHRYSLTRPPRWSDPHDLLEIVRCICRFREMEPQLTKELMAEAARRFFCDV